MVRKHLAQICIIAALSLLAVVFSLWMKPLNSFDTQTFGKSEKIRCLVPTSSTVYLAEVKPRLSGCGGTANEICFFKAPSLCLRHTAWLPESNALALLSPGRIWLLHRSLLI